MGPKKRQACLTVLLLILVSVVFLSESGVTLLAPGLLSALLFGVGALGCGFLARVLGHRRMAVMATLLLGAGIVLPSVSRSGPVWLGLDGLFSLGLGIAVCLLSAAHTHQWGGEARARALGYAGALGNVACLLCQLGGTTLGALGGLLRGLLSLLFLSGLVLLLRHPSRQNGAAADAVKAGLRLKTLLLSAFNGLIAALLLTYVENITAVVNSVKFRSPELDWLLLLVLFGTGSLAGVFYKSARKELQGFALPTALGFVAAAFFIMVMTQTEASFLVGAMFLGFGAGTYFPEIAFRVLASAPPQGQVQAWGVFWAFFAAGQGLSAQVLVPLATYFGFDYTGQLATWNLAAFGITVIFLVSIFYEVARENPAAGRV